MSQLLTCDIAVVGSRPGVYHVSGVDAEPRTSWELWTAERKSFSCSGSVRAGRMAVSRFLRQGAVRAARSARRLAAA